MGRMASGSSAAARRNSPLVAPLLRRSSDGIWYLQYGIYGPAIAVSQGWLVISYSPEALRANLMPPESLRSGEEARVPVPLGQSHPGHAADEAKTQFDDEQTGDQNPPEQPGSDQAEEDQ